MSTRSFTVVVDTREKKPWELASARVLGKEYKALKTGDYTVAGLEDKLCIDRKMSVNELATNVMQARFKRELERMKEFPHAFLVLEADFQEVLDYPNSSDLPAKVRKKIRMNGGYLIRCLSRMQIKYGFNVIFAGNRANAERIAVNLMEDVLELYETQT